MDSFLENWNTDVGVEFNLPIHHKSCGLNNELMELLWQNGEVVLQSQKHGKQNFAPSNSKKNNQSPSRGSENPDHHDHETILASWIDCPIDESFEKEFCVDLLSEIPSSTATEVNKPSENFDVREEKLNAHQHNFGHLSNLHLPVKRLMVPESSAMTIGSSHCASNQVVNEVDMSWTSIGGRNRSLQLEVSHQSEKKMLGQAVTSFAGGSGTSFRKTRIQSNDPSNHKRKNRDAEESECPSDATESAAGNKSSQKSGTSRRSRVAEVHNLSERKRRDRINEKMKALQELIPHSNKADKASMLDEAIEYMKSLQLQLQLMWMGSGMAPIMHPGMPHYMHRVGMRTGAPMLPAIQNLMNLSTFPLIDQGITLAPWSNQAQIGQSPMLNPVNYQNSSFPKQYANYIGFHSMPSTSQQMNIFNFSSHSMQAQLQ